MQPNEEELKRWGFYKREDGVWYNNHLCMEIRVHKILRNSKDLDEYDFIHAVFEHGKMNGISEMQENLQRTLGIN